MSGETYIGHTWPAFEVVVERGSAIAFAQGLGEKNPIYLDEASAKAAGFRSIPVLPTFPIALSAHRFELVMAMLKLLAIDPARVLHGGQRFVHHQPIFTEDRLTGQMRIENVSSKKNGALTIVETVLEYRNAAGAIACEDHSTLVARNL